MIHTYQIPTSSQLQRHFNHPNLNFQWDHTIQHNHNLISPLPRLPYCKILWKWLKLSFVCYLRDLFLGDPIKQLKSLYHPSYKISSLVIVILVNQIFKELFHRLLPLDNLFELHPIHEGKCWVLITHSWHRPMRVINQRYLAK